MSDDWKIELRVNRFRVGCALPGFKTRTVEEIVGYLRIERKLNVHEGDTLSDIVATDQNGRRYKVPKVFILGVGPDYSTGVTDGPFQAEDGELIKDVELLKLPPEASEYEKAMNELPTVQTVADSFVLPAHLVDPPEESDDPIVVPRPPQ